MTYPPTEQTITVETEVEAKADISEAVTELSNLVFSAKIAKARAAKQSREERNSNDRIPKDWQ